MKAIAAKIAGGIKNVVTFPFRAVQKTAAVASGAFHSIKIIVIIAIIILLIVLICKIVSAFKSGGSSGKNVININSGGGNDSSRGNGLRWK